MTGISRRHFIKRGTILTGALAVPSLFMPISRVNAELYRVPTTATPPFVPVNILNTTAMPWSAPIKVAHNEPFGKPHYYRQAHQFNYILNGDLQLQCWASPGQKAEQVKLTKDYYFEKPPMSITGLADGTVSETGCVWLQVTYAKGTSIPNVPIEDAVYI